MSDRFYAKACCGHHKHETIAEALACTNVESPDSCGPLWRGERGPYGDSPCRAHSIWGKCEGVRALVWAWGDFTFVGLTPNEHSELSKMTNPAWWDKHRPGWREKQQQL